LNQFIGYSDGDYLLSGKNIDAISGATVSEAGIIADIELQTSLLANFFRTE